MIWNKYPYTNFHEMNLDWILNELKTLVDEWNKFEHTYTEVTVEAYNSTTPEAEVEKTPTGLHFEFGLPQGEKGERGIRGERGEKGEKGDTGSGLEIKDVYATVEDLESAHPTGQQGDMYLVGTNNEYELYIWSTSDNTYVPGGQLSSPQPSNTLPLEDNEASVGSSLRYAKADHIHPKDSSKLDVRLSTGDTTNVYAFNNEEQVDIQVNELPQANTIVMYNESGDINVNGLIADEVVSDNVIANTLQVNNNNILNSGTLERMALLQNGFVRCQPNQSTGFNELISSGLDLVDNVPMITASYQRISEGAPETVFNNAYFSDEFYLNETNPSKRKISLKKATANQLGGIKVGAGLNITNEGVLSTTSPLELLWENSSPSSEFLPQTISLNLQSYSIVIVMFRLSTSTTYRTNSLSVTFGYDIQAISRHNADIYSRLYTPKASEIVFYNGLDNSGSIDNNRMVPFRIYGMK